MRWQVFQCGVLVHEDGATRRCFQVGQLYRLLRLAFHLHQVVLGNVTFVDHYPDISRLLFSNLEHKIKVAIRGIGTLFNVVNQLYISLKHCWEREGKVGISLKI